MIKKVLAALIFGASLCLNLLLGYWVHDLKQEQQWYAAARDDAQFCVSQVSRQQQESMTWRRDAYRCLADLTELTDQLNAIAGEGQ